MENIQHSEINCPLCKEGKIILDMRAILAGASFACPNCHASVSLPQESKAVVSDALDELDKLKAQQNPG